MLPDSVAGILIAAIRDLAANPSPSGCKKLKGRDGYRIRKGDFRNIYDIYDKILTVQVITIGNRRDIYE
ncbi:MAG: type II toxin-antitoxin system RelE/ParE family toxin [Bacteroidota bacterium]|nr:type II toxin-antitoxin system RelE/ParE family toxin [Bacteroidota bacterium]